MHLEAQHDSECQCRSECYNRCDDSSCATSRRHNRWTRTGRNVRIACTLSETHLIIAIIKNRDDVLEKGIAEEEDRYACLRLN